MVNGIIFIVLGSVGFFICLVMMMRFIKINNISITKRGIVINKPKVNVNIEIEENYTGNIKSEKLNKITGGLEKKKGEIIKSLDNQYKKKNLENMEFEIINKEKVEIEDPGTEVLGISEENHEEDMGTEVLGISEENYEEDMGTEVLGINEENHEEDMGTEVLGISEENYEEDMGTEVLGIREENYEEDMGTEVLGIREENYEENPGTEVLGISNSRKG